MKAIIEEESGPGPVFQMFCPPTPPMIDFGSKRKFRYGQKAVQIRTEPKIGRNDSCPCGSGIKYKKCCEK